MTERIVAAVVDMPCLGCGASTNRLTGPPGPSRTHPRPGDFLFCFECGHAMAFGDDMRPRKLTAAENATIGKTQMRETVQAYIRKARKGLDA